MTDALRRGSSSQLRSPASAAAMSSSPAAAGTGSGSELLELLAIDPDRAAVEAISRLGASGISNERCVREAQDVLVAYQRTRKTLPEASTVQLIDTLAEQMLALADTVPSVEAARAVQILSTFMQSDDRVVARFKPTRQTLNQLHLSTYIAGTDRPRGKIAMDFALFLLHTYDTVDLSLITTDQALVSKILWADRQELWLTVRERGTEMPELQHQVACLRASVDSQFAAMNELRSVHQQQEGSIATHAHTIVDVEGDMRRVLATVKQLEVTSKSQAASIRALEIASKAQSAAVQQLQDSLRDEKTVLRALREGMDKMEHNTVSSLVEAKSASSANRAALETLEQTLAALAGDVQSMHAVVRTHADNLDEHDATLRAQREQLVQLEAAVHPVFGAIEALQTSNRSGDSVVAKARAELDETLASSRREVQALEEELRRVDATVKEVAQRANAQQSSSLRQHEDVASLASQVKAIAADVNALSATSDAAVSGLQETVKQHSIVLKRLKGDAETSGAPGTPTAGTPLSPRMSFSGVADVSSSAFQEALLQVAQHSALIKSHTDALDELDRAMRTVQKQTNEIAASTQADNALLQKLQTTTSYDARQLRQSSEGLEFRVHDLSEQTKALLTELHEFMAAHKQTENDVNKVLATSKYQQLSVQQLESLSRQQTSDLSSVRELSSALDIKVTTLLADKRQSDGTWQKFRSDVETSLQQISKTLDVHSTSVFELRDMATSADSTLQTLERTVAAHDSQLHVLSGSLESSVSQLRAAVDVLEADLKQEHGVVALHTTSIQELQTNTNANSSGLQDLKGSLKATAGDLHQLSLRTTAMDQTLQKTTSTAKMLSTTTSQLRTMLDAQETALHKQRDTIDTATTQLRSGFKTLEADLAQQRIVSKQTDQSISSALEAVRTLDADLDSMSKTLRAHEEAVSTNTSVLETLDAAVARTASEVGQQVEVVNSIRKTSEVIQHSLANHTETLASHERSVTDLLSSRHDVEAAVARVVQSQELVQRLSQSVGVLERDMQQILGRLDETEQHHNEQAAALHHVQQERQIEIPSLRALQSQIQAHTEEIEKARVLQRELSDVVGALRRDASLNQTDISHLKETSETQARTIQVAATKQKETFEFINQEARTRARDLQQSTLTASERMASMGWVARNMRFLEAPTVETCIEAFRSYAQSHRESFAKCSRQQVEEVLDAMFGLLNSSLVEAGNGTAADGGLSVLPDLLVILDSMLLSDAALLLALKTHSVVPLLFRCLGLTEVSPRVNALTVLATVCRSDAAVQEVVLRPDYELLVKLMTGMHTDLAIEAASVIRVCLRTDVGLDSFARCLPLFLELLSHPSDAMRDHAAAGLRHFTRKEEKVHQVVSLNGLETMLRASRESTKPYSKNCIAALRNCARNIAVQKQIHQLGGLDLLGIRYPVVK